MVPELRPRGIGEILDSAVALYRSRFRRLLLVAATVVVPVQFLSALVLLSAQPDRYTVTVAGTATPQFDASSAAVQFAAVVVVVADASIGGSSETRDEVRAVRPRVFAIVGTSLLVLVSEAIGLAFCGVGAFVPLTLFAVALPVLILEGIGVSAALGRSVTLTKGHAMHVLGLVLTAQLLAFILNGALSLGVRIMVHTTTSTVATVIGQSIASTIAGVLTTPFVATAIVVLYLDLRIRDEAFDVQLLMQRNDTRIAS